MERVQKRLPSGRVIMCHILPYTVARVLKAGLLLHKRIPFLFNTNLMLGTHGQKDFDALLNLAKYQHKKLP